MDNLKQQLEDMRQLMNGGTGVLRETIMAAAIEAENCEFAAEAVDRANAARERLKASLQRYESPLHLPRYDDPVHSRPLVATDEYQDALGRTIDEIEMAHRFSPRPPPAPTPIRPAHHGHAQTAPAEVPSSMYFPPTRSVRA